ncbi:MAG TPA: hypothetical protein VGH11_07730 [Jatrophihabitans sp.]|jgi:hypothetical protein
MEITGWISGQMFLQTVDQADVETVTTFLNARSIPYQILTTTEQVVMEADKPDDSFAVDRFSIAVQLGGFPHIVSQVINDLAHRAHANDWSEPSEG